MPDAPAAPAAPPAPPADTLVRPSSSDSAQLQDAFGALDAYSGEEPKAGDARPPASRPGAGAPERPTTGKSPSGESAAPNADTSSQAKKSDSPPKADGKPPTPPEPDPEVPVEKMAPKALRESYVKAKAQIKEAEAKLKELSERISKPPDDTEKKELSERLAAREKRLAEIEEEVRFTNYEKSEEYKTKYYEPFLEAFREGRTIAESLEVFDENGEARPGTPADFDRIMKVSDAKTAAALAKELFGDASTEIMIARRDVMKANNARVQALQEYRTKGSEREKQQSEQGAKLVSQLRESWQTLNKAAADKYPQWFKPSDGESLDPKSNELLANGMALADRAFSDSKIEPLEMVKLHSAIRNKAGAFDRVVYELDKTKKTVKELQAKLAEIEASSPGPGTRRSTTPKSSELDWEGRLNTLAKPM